MKRLLFLLAILALPASGQTKLALGQLPGCAITSTTPTAAPIILAIVPTSSGTTQFACYTLAGVTITPATATSPATITLPVTLPVFVNGETPSGVLDGKNAAFALAAAPSPSSSLELFRNGILQAQPGDYTLTGSVATFTPGATPQPGDILQAAYRH